MPRWTDEEIEFSGETDTQDIRLTAGRTYYFEMMGQSTDDGTLSDGVLELFLRGDSIAFDDDGGAGSNARLVFRATETATYSIQASGYGDSTGTYKLMAYRDDFRGAPEMTDGNSTGEVGDLASGTQLRGTINYGGDADIFQTTLIRGLTYTFEQKGSATNDGKLGDSFLTLLDGEDTILAEDDDGGEGYNSAITFRATSTSSDYFLQAKAYSDSDTGTYMIEASAGRATNGNDRVTGTDYADAIEGRNGQDTLSGGGGDDLLRGGNGRDQLRGGDGADTLYGGAGEDVLRGQDGADVMMATSGADVLIGGQGSDTFVFDQSYYSRGSNTDVIRGGDGASAFRGAGNSIGDLIDLSGIDANTTRGGNQAFEFGGTGIGQLSLINQGGDTYVRGNTDRDSAFEFTLLIEDGRVSAAKYTEADFLL